MSESDGFCRFKNIKEGVLKAPLPSPLLKGEGIFIIKVIPILNHVQLPLPLGEGWGEG
jgi:hypothetical protein